MFEELQREQIVRIKIEAVPPNSTSVKLQHTDMRHRHRAH